MDRFSRPAPSPVVAAARGERSFGSRLAPRSEVPADGGWQRLHANPSRKRRLAEVFGESTMSAGHVVAVIGPPQTGKSAVALAACDLRGLRAAYATVDTHQAALEPQNGLCVIIDPVSAFSPGDVLDCIKAYRGTSPVILVDRHERALARLGDLTGLVDSVWRLALPKADVIAEYIAALLEDPDTGRRYEHTLTAADFAALGQAMHGLSLPQVNQIAVDAALARLQHGEPVDRASFDEALGALRAIQAQGGEA